MPIRPINKWVTRALFMLGGYVLRWWLDAEAASQENDSESSRPVRRAPRHRPPPPQEELKLVLVVNDSLKMGKGKIGAQCAHGAVGIVEELHSQGRQVLLAHWEECGQSKICLKARDDGELSELAAKARATGLPTFAVHDAGRTQIAAGSWTVLAIGPAGRSDIDKVTGQLRLL